MVALLALGAAPALASAPPTPTDVSTTLHDGSAAVDFDALTPPTWDFVK
jgi:hypothetical protein